jgi:hypothetical protein
MTPESQRIAIAEACGWVNIPRPDSGNPCWYKKGEFVATKPEHLPDYLNDLNAMHEAENVLSVGQHLSYDQQLTSICGTMEYRATAAQRAEAFLRTIGKWVE